MNSQSSSNVISDVLYSGGARGADLLFGFFASRVGHEVRHIIFTGHKCPSKDVWVLNKIQLNSWEQLLKSTAETLDKNLPTDSFVKKLMQRNMWQAVMADTIYAVTYIDWDKNLIAGGTGWAVTAAILRGDKKAIYVYDQGTKSWYAATKFFHEGEPEESSYYIQPKDIEWVKIDAPPKPEGRYAGIGSRDLTEDGHNAIKDLYKDM